MASDDEDDYMTMTFDDPSTTSKQTTKPARETPLQRHKRLQREADTKGRTKSKAEIAAEEKVKREEALKRSLFDGKGDGGVGGGVEGLGAQSKGLKMMQKLGYKVGEGLGKKVTADNGNGNGNGVAKGDGAASTTSGPVPLASRIEPIMLEIKEGKGGIGLDTERKRKIREEFESEAKRVKAEEGEYRDRVVKERTDRRNEGLVHGAQKVAERLEIAAVEDGFEGEGVPTGKEKLEKRRLKDVNVLWRGLIRQREEKDRERRMRRDMLTRLEALPAFANGEEDDDDRIAMGKAEDVIEAYDIDDEDQELDEFEALDPAERLAKLVEHLRTNHHYCFWCKFQYPDAQMDGCPGVTEDDHD